MSSLAILLVFSHRRQEKETQLCFDCKICNGNVLKGRLPRLLISLLPCTFHIFLAILRAKIRSLCCDAPSPSTNLNGRYLPRLLTQMKGFFSSSFLWPFVYLSVSLSLFPLFCRRKLRHVNMQFMSRRPGITTETLFNLVTSVLWLFN